MGCGPSRSSLGRVGDSTCEYNKTYLEEHKKSKRKGTKSNREVQKTPTYNAFSSTTKLYNHIDGTSKITLRLSTDGSMLEIEQYDYDNNITNECTSEEVWRENRQQLKPTVRCESAPVTRTLIDNDQNAGTSTHVTLGHLEKAQSAACNRHSSSIKLSGTVQSTQQQCVGNDRYAGHIISTSDTKSSRILNQTRITCPGCVTNLEDNDNTFIIPTSQCTDQFETMTLACSKKNRDYFKPDTLVKSQTLHLPTENGISKQYIHGALTSVDSINEPIPLSLEKMKQNYETGRKYYMKRGSTSQFMYTSKPNCPMDEDVTSIRCGTELCCLIDNAISPFGNGNMPKHFDGNSQPLSKVSCSKEDLLYYLPLALHTGLDSNCRTSLLSEQHMANVNSHNFSSLIQRGSNHETCLQPNKLGHSILSQTCEKSMQPRENKTDSVERRWERQIIGSCLETDYCSSQIRDDISKRTAMSTETASDMGNGSDSAIGHAWPTQVLATEQSDAAKSQMYIDTCDCEFCVHSSLANTLRYNKLFLSNGEGQDLEDRFSYEYSCGELGDNACAWEDDCYQNDCDENNIEELTRLNLDNIADDTETDITDSDTECNLSFKVGPLVSSMFSNEDHLYGYSDHGNEGDIDSTDDDDERDVYMDAMETSYV